MKKLILSIGALALMVAVAVTAAVAKTAGSADVCVLLPDTKSSVRWEQFDKPDIGAALKKAGVSYSIANALNDAQKQKSQADQCLSNGAKVIVIVNIDPASAAAIQKDAAKKGAKSIDYDRQTIGGSAVAYVSFDGGSVGVVQGKGLIAGLKSHGMFAKKPVIAELNGGKTDSNAFLFKKGYDSVLNPLYKNGTFVKGPDQFVPGWLATNAQPIFDQMLLKTNNKIDGAIAANDNIAGAIIASLKAHKLKPIALTGQDASIGGAQNILAGWQSMTVYKPVPLEAAAVAKVAVQVLKGQKITGVNASFPNGSKKEPAILIPVVSVTKANVGRLFADKFLKKSDVCVGVYKQYCK